jgi:YD repeat-containing protein
MDKGEISMEKFVNIRGFSKTSGFGEAAFDLMEKADFRPFFRGPSPKAAGLWKRLITVVLVLIFSSCASGPKGEGGDSASRTGAAGRARAGQVPVETKEAVLFADGSLDEYTTMDYDPTFTNMINQNRYSASGALLEKVEFAYHDEQGWLTTKLTRDVEDRLKTRIVYEYDGQGQLRKETLTNKAGKAVSAYEYTYDDRGNRVSRSILNAAGGKLAETVYTVNNAGMVLSSETRDGSGKKINSTENQYDSGGNLTGQKVYNASGELSSSISAVWSEGRELENQQMGADGTVQMRVTSEYGSSGELLRKKVENIQGESTQLVEYEYVFKPGQRSK